MMTIRVKKRVLKARKAMRDELVRMPFFESLLTVSTPFYMMDSPRTFFARKFVEKRSAMEMTDLKMPTAVAKL